MNYIPHVTTYIRNLRLKIVRFTEVFDQSKIWSQQSTTMDVKNMRILRNDVPFVGFGLGIGMGWGRWKCKAELFDTVDGRNPANQLILRISEYRIFQRVWYISTGAGFLRSTVWWFATVSKKKGWIKDFNMRQNKEVICNKTRAVFPQGYSSHGRDLLRPPYDALTFDSRFM